MRCIGSAAARVRKLAQGEPKLRSITFLSVDKSAQDYVAISPCVCVCKRRFSIVDILFRSRDRRAYLRPKLKAVRKSTFCSHPNFRRDTNIILILLLEIDSCLSANFNFLSSIPTLFWTGDAAAGSVDNRCYRDDGRRLSLAARATENYPRKRNIPEYNRTGSSVNSTRTGANRIIAHL